MSTRTYDLRRETEPSQGRGGSFIWNETRQKMYLSLPPLLEEILSREHHNGYYVLETPSGNYLVSDMMTVYRLPDDHPVFQQRY